MTIYSYKWHEVDKFMTITIYKELSKHQKRFPPVYQLICGYFGVGELNKESSKKSDNKIDSSMLAFMNDKTFLGEVPQPREI